MKKAFFITLFSFLWASEPLTLPIAESGEQKILARMASTPEWQGELQLASPLDEQIQFFINQGYTIKRVETPRQAIFFNHSFEDIPNSVILLDTPAKAKAWLEEEVIPFLNLPPSRQEAFMEDFLSYLGPASNSFIYRKLYLEVEPKR